MSRHFYFQVVPIAFERGDGAFGETVDRFIEDLTTKSVSVSRRPSMDAYRDDGFIIGVYGNALHRLWEGVSDPKGEMA